ncbi:hypothetical protein PTMSG1_03610 [Pyrenophora teres f. maculata]|nr:hypothetical protein PTMSG1_03610 [Pyrenophora teres f. maculata]
MQYHLLNVLVVALPFLGSVSAWTNPVAKCEASIHGQPGNCASADATQCTTNPNIYRQCGRNGTQYHSAWAHGQRCDCYFTRG